MNIFKGIEKRLESLVEGGFGRAFKSSVQPVELAHKLAKEMNDHKTVGVANVYVPNEFDIYLGHDDYEHLTSLGDSLKAELSNYLMAFARREGWTLVASPSIGLHEDRDLRLGEFGIATRTVTEPAAPVRSQSPAPSFEGSGAPAAPRRAVVRGADGNWEVTSTVTVLGRSRRCDIVVDDPNVSRQHAEIRRQDDTYVIRDLQSTNGLRVNRRKVEQCVLQDGDRIELGTAELLFERLP